MNSTDAAATKRGDAALSWLKKRLPREEKLFLYITLVPFLLVVLATVGYAALFLVVLSFRDASTLGIGASSFVGLETFREVLGSTETQVSLRNSLVWVAASAFLVVTLGVITGNFLSSNSGVARFSRAFMLLPWVLPGAVVAATWQWMLNSEAGAINDVLIRLGIFDNGYQWLGSQQTALAAVIAVMVWRLFPLFALVVASAIQTIDVSLYDAAKVDGASGWTLFRHITLPSIRTHVMTMGLLSTVWIVENLVFVQVMTGGGPLYASQTLPVYLYKLAFDDFALSQASVVSLINVVIVLFIGWLYLKSMRRAEREA